MKILVCFKAVKDIDYVLKSDLPSVADNTMDWSYVRAIFNCYDEGALENALLLKESLNDDSTVDAISITEFDCDLFNKHILAAGFNSVVNLKTDCSHFTPYKNAQIIYNYIKDKNYDIVLTGEENAAGNNGVFPYALADLLNFDVLTNVSDLICDSSLGFIVKCDTPNETATYKAKTKAVYSFKNTENAYLRFPSLMDRLKAKNKEEIIVDAENIDTTKDVKIINAYYKEEKLVPTFMSGELEDIVNSLLEKEVTYD